MSLFLVLSETPQPALSSAVAAIPNSREWTQHKAFVVPFAGTAKALTDSLTTDTEVRRNGILVVKIDADYYGFSNTPNWDWLAAAFRRETNG